MKLGKPLAIGNTASIYRSQDKVIKLMKEGFPATEVYFEAKKQAFAYACGLDVPKIVMVTEIDGRQALIMEYIEGPTIGERLVENMEQVEHYIDICVRVHRTIHQAIPKAPSIERMPDKLYRQINHSEQIPEAVKVQLFQRMNKIQFEPRLCHGDFHPFNVIMSKDRLTIIDWVDASMGDIRADLYRTYLLLSSFSIDTAEYYLRSYCKQADLSKEEVFRWAPIIAGARLSEQIPLEQKEPLVGIITSFL